MNPYYVNSTVIFKIEEENPNHYLKTKQKKMLKCKFKASPIENPSIPPVLTTTTT